MYQTERNGQEWTDALEYIVEGDQLGMPNRPQEKQRPEDGIEAEEQDRPTPDGRERPAERTRRTDAAFHITGSPDIPCPAWPAPASSCSIACQRDVARAQR